MKKAQPKTKPKRDRTLYHYEYEGMHYTRRGDEVRVRDPDGNRVSPELTETIEAKGLPIYRLSKVSEILGERITTLIGYRNLGLLPRHRYTGKDQTYYNPDEVKPAIEHIREQIAKGVTLIQQSQKEGKK